MSPRLAQPSPRVTKPRLSPLPFPNGTVLTKVFDNTIHKGTVLHHDARRKLCKVMSHNKVARELHLDKQRLSKLTQLPTHNENWTAQQSVCRTQSLHIQTAQHWFCNPANNLSPNWHDNAPGIQQAHKCANSALDKETGKQLEHGQLIKHPRLQNAWLHAAGNEFGRLFQGVKNKNGV